eukprot:TRINITY_DN2011_c0_g1_i1.p2 TRINITY_DN2011_c0_g1~~TRINITY_DN2011_c0_g1_i1.p2  ORF type:complete len:120 (-),score=55.40 TRINITY_DN2011_c0_g1_i1:77-436(-)
MNAIQASVKHQNTLEKRKEVSAKILFNFYPQRVPVILETLEADSHEINKKFLTLSETTVETFVQEVKKRMHVRPDEKISILVNDSIPPSEATMFLLYVKNRDEDGFLYVNLLREAKCCM